MTLACKSVLLKVSNSDLTMLITNTCTLPYIFIGNFNERSNRSNRSSDRRDRLKLISGEMFFSC